MNTFSLNCKWKWGNETCILDSQCSV